jgi:hypothetical protein
MVVSIGLNPARWVVSAISLEVERIDHDLPGSRVDLIIDGEKRGIEG